MYDTYVGILMSITGSRLPFGRLVLQTYKQWSKLQVCKICLFDEMPSVVVLACCCAVNGCAVELLS